jgi:hypothetical protein
MIERGRPRWTQIYADKVDFQVPASLGCPRRYKKLLVAITIDEATAQRMIGADFICVDLRSSAV